MAFKSNELLNVLLNGHQLTPDELDEMLNNKVSEDLYLDYKHGKVLEKPDKRQAPELIREYVSGFANSSGGVLILGVDEKSWTVTGAKAPGGGDLAEWGARCLTPMHHHFSPMPKFQVINHPDGDVLLAFVDRTLNLIPLTKNRKLNYYFRMHDQTLEAPDYLVSDLLLGKRHHPLLSITKFRLASPRKTKTQYGLDLEFQIGLTVENESIVWGDAFKLGIIYFAKNAQENTIPLGRHLQSHIDIQHPKIEYLKHTCMLHHEVLFGDKATPFFVAGIANRHRIRVPLRTTSVTFPTYIWKAAVYLTPKGSPPIWYQLEVNMGIHIATALTNNLPLTAQGDYLELKRISGEWPIVALANFKTE